MTANNSQGWDDDEEIKVETSYEDELFGDPQWFKFEKPGDVIAGKVIGVRTEPAKDDYKEQKVVTLERHDGSKWNVGFSTDKKFHMAMIAGISLGDSLGVKFIKEIPASKRGYHPAKSMMFRLSRNGSLIKQEFDKEKTAEYYSALIKDQK